MADNDSGTAIVGFLLGGVLGVAAGLLLAPCSGDETRERIGDWLEENRAKTRDFIQKEREAIHDKKEQVAAAFEAGKRAFREAERS